jgi:hypothetical protein
MGAPLHDPSRVGPTEADSNNESTTGTPRWVKIFVVVTVIVVVLFLVLLLVGGHSPRRHGLDESVPAVSPLFRDAGS